jgi:hypothetical protein
MTLSSSCSYRRAVDTALHDMKQQQDRTVEQFVEYNKDKQAMGKVRRQFKVLLFSSFIILTFVLFCDFCRFVCFLFHVLCLFPF